ncbi:MAG TPA: CbbQ/NirQ/NorQ/GpvN family protein [Euryarchaeota archaeon]|nr:denitrification regulatory protein NirQ [archaeon]HEQ78011.1 CbbQ/NirQ/NorQ/GpvN family protein [Euryarchaeota archaeon]
MTGKGTEAIKIEEYFITEEPYYMPVSNEIEVFEAAFKNKLPVMLKGPTGCGKTRFMQYMAWKLKRPLITVSCHDDLTSSDLVGRYLVKGGETIWIDGPLTKAVKVGAICYLDEIVEARKDTTVVIHPLTDDRRVLPIEKRGEILKAPDEFLLSISYNPGYQSVLKDLKHSTRQRFISLNFEYPPRELEIEIVMKESGINKETAGYLVTLAEKIRNLKDKGLDEGTGTRALIYAGTLIQSGISEQQAAEVAMANPITDDSDMLRAIKELITTVF